MKAMEQSAKAASARRERRICAAMTAVLMLYLVMLGGGGGKEETFDLAGLRNPFIGTWQYDIPSAGTTLIFEYKPDGTFDYEMAGVPEEQDGKFVPGNTAPFTRVK